MVEELLKKELATYTLTSYGVPGGGCINQGHGYMTDAGPVFVKRNSKEEAKQMFDGEYASLAKLYATNTVPVPKPIKVIDNPAGGALFVAEYIELHGLSRFSAELGRQLAR
ncbi:unnamed protein product [Soboliphyme baturini]|uniref:protein-ribulosamine 3-kinase n=1 Tax=Soboliphyme baturini TaxID=241478 RepID=A0A183J7L2_9BILA|nr:unnamed protein product [Soboliphyme baturini]